MATIDTLLDSARGIDTTRTDYRATTNSLFVNDIGQIAPREKYTVVNGGDPAPLYMTKHALGQIAQRLGISYGRAFLSNNESLPQHIVADILNHFLDYTPDKELLLRQYNGSVRGVLSDKYLIMDHAWVLEQAKRFLVNPDTGEPVQHIVAPNWRIEPDYMQATIILRGYNPDGGSDGMYGLGASIRNGTVGNASTGVASVIMRTSCTNSIRDRRVDWTIRHVGSTEILSMRESLIIAAFAEAFQSSQELADKLIRARQQRLPNVYDIISTMTESQQLPESMIPVIAAGTEQQNSLFGLINGLTYAAHTSLASEDIDADKAEDLEAFAGHLLTKFGDGETEGDRLARLLFAEAKTTAHVLVNKDE